VRIVVTTSAGVPLYEQIKQQIKAAILAGALTEGEALPSVRALARDLQVSVITTTRAYTDLAQEGFVANVQGKGAYVLAVDSAPVHDQLLRDVEANLGAALRAARVAGMTRDDVVALLDTLLDAHPTERNPA
jgi:GntR family transcriptional regulator